MGDYNCPNCGADLKKQWSFNEYDKDVVCEECNKKLHREYSNFSVVADRDLCPKCDANLLKQFGYTYNIKDWKCKECKAVLHRDYTSFQFNLAEEKFLCPNCNTYLKNQWDYDDYDMVCEECNAKLYRKYSGDKFIIVKKKDLCPRCGANLIKQFGYSEYTYDHTCEECNLELHRDFSDDVFSIVDAENICPNCGALLIQQSGFNEYDEEWTCEGCGVELTRDYYDEEFTVKNDIEKEYNSYSYTRTSTSSVYPGYSGGVSNYQNIYTDSQNGYKEPPKHSEKNRLKDFYKENKSYYKLSKAGKYHLLIGFMIFLAIGVLPYFVIPWYWWIVFGLLSIESCVACGFGHAFLINFSRGITKVFLAIDLGLFLELINIYICEYYKASNLILIGVTVGVFALNYLSSFLIAKYSFKKPISG